MVNSKIFFLLALTAHIFDEVEKRFRKFATCDLASYLYLSIRLIFSTFLRKLSSEKNLQFLPTVQKLKAIFVQKLKVGAAFI